MIKEILAVLIGKFYSDNTSEQLLSHSNNKLVGLKDARRNWETGMEQIPEPEFVISLFKELLTNLKTGLIEKNRRHRWGAFEEINAEESKRTGFVVDAAFFTTGRKPEFSLVARAVENGEPGGYGWVMSFSPKGTLTSIAKIIDTQNITEKKDEFEMRGEIYYPSKNERQKKEGLHAVSTLLLESLDESKRVSLATPSQENELFI